MNILINHHILLCATPTNASCCDLSIGSECWKHLKHLLRKFDLENPQRPKGIVLRSKVDCLRICNNGPIMLIWPDGTWYGNITPEKIDEIIVKHIINGNAIEDWIIKKTPFSSTSNYVESIS